MAEGLSDPPPTTKIAAAAPTSGGPPSAAPTGGGPPSLAPAGAGPPASATTELGDAHETPAAHGAQAAPVISPAKTQPPAWVPPPAFRSPGFWPRRPAVERRAPPRPDAGPVPSVSRPSQTPEQRYPTAEVPAASAFPRPGVWVAAVVIAGLIGGAIGFFLIGPRPQPGVMEMVVDPSTTAELTRLVARLDEDPDDMAAQQRLRDAILQFSQKLTPGPQRDQLERLTSLSNSTEYVESLRVAANIIIMQAEPM